MKRRSILVFVAMLAIMMSSFVAMAATIYSEGYFRYTDNGGSVTIVEYFGKEETVTIPNMIAGEPVSKIAKGAFANSNVKSVYVPDTVVSIEAGAFPSGTEVYFLESSSESLIPEGAVIKNDDTEKSDDKTTESTTSNTVVGSDNNSTGNISDGGYEEVVVDDIGSNASDKTDTTNKVDVENQSQDKTSDTSNDKLSNDKITNERTENEKIAIEGSDDDENINPDVEVSDETTEQQMVTLDYAANGEEDEMVYESKDTMSPKGEKPVNSGKLTLASVLTIIMVILIFAVVLIIVHLRKKKNDE